MTDARNADTITPVADRVHCCPRLGIHPMVRVWVTTPLPHGFRPDRMVIGAINLCSLRDKIGAAGDAV